LKLIIEADDRGLNGESFCSAGGTTNGLQPVIILGNSTVGLVPSNAVQTIEANGDILTGASVTAPSTTINNEFQSSSMRLTPSIALLLIIYFVL
jgi:hypothetical protein